MTVTMTGPTGTRVRSGASGPGPGLRAVLHCIDRLYVSVRTGQRVRPPGPGGNYWHPGRPRDAMRDRMPRRTPTPIDATP
jgi:hypothetical protein